MLQEDGISPIRSVVCYLKGWHDGRACRELGCLRMDRTGLGGYDGETEEIDSILSGVNWGFGGLGGLECGQCADSPSMVSGRQYGIRTDNKDCLRDTIGGEHKEWDQLVVLWRV